MSRLLRRFYATYSPYHNTAFMLLGHYGNKIAVFVLFALIARVAGDIVIGQFAIANTYSVFAFLVVSFGIDKLIARQIAVQELEADVAISNALIFQLALWLPVSLFLIFFPRNIGVDIETTNAIAILSIWVLLTAIKSVFDGVFNGLERLQFTSVLNLFSGLVLLLVGIIAIFLSPRVTSIAIAMAIERAITISLYFFLWYSVINSDKKFRPLWDRINLRVIHNLVKLSVPFAVFAVIASMFQRIDILLLSFFVTDADIGHYAAAYRFIDIMMLIPGMLGMSLFPVISRTIKSDVGTYRTIASSAIERGLVIMWPILWILFLYSKDLVVQIFGSQFAISGDVLTILIWGVLIQVVNNILGRSIMAYKEKDLIVLGVIALSSNVLINLLLVPSMGIYGAAWATVSSYIVSMAVHIVILSVRGVSIRYNFLVRPMLIYAASLVIYLFVVTYSRQVAVTISLGVYVGLIAAFGYIPRPLTNKIRHLLSI